MSVEAIGDLPDVYGINSLFRYLLEVCLINPGKKQSLGTDLRRGHDRALNDTIGGSGFEPNFRLTMITTFCSFYQLRFGRSPLAKDTGDDKKLAR
ncbi:MAG: hypothetical protein M1514_00475 [Patescibacteria group bacterium]|nr:hypothetical protein [Patescibacteria group bacterium]